MFSISPLNPPIHTEKGEGTGDIWNEVDFESTTYFHNIQWKPTLTQKIIPNKRLF